MVTAFKQFLLWNSYFFPFVSLFYFCHTKNCVAMRPLGYPGVAGPVWYNTENYLFILLLNSTEPYRRTFNWDSPSKLITGGSIRQRSSWRLCLSLARNWQRKKKVFICFNFSTTVIMDLKQSLNLLRNLRLPKWLNFSRNFVSNLYLFGHALKTSWK